MKTLLYSTLTMCLGLSLLETQAQNLSEGFEGVFPPEDWSVVNNGDNNTWFQYTSSSSAQEGTKMARINYSATSAHDDWLITPKLSITASNDSIHFWAKNSSGSYPDKFNVKISTGLQNPTEFTTTIDTLVSPGTSWQKYSYDLSAYNGQDIYVALQAVSTNQYYLYVDNFTGPTLFVPSCPKPDSIAVSSLDATTASFTWPAVSNAQSYYYQVFEQGDVPGSATAVTEGSVSSAQVSVSGLSASTAYDLYVSSTCSATDSSDFRIYNFETPCVGYASLSENFENLNGDDLPGCWSSIDNASANYGSVKAVTYGSPANGSYHLRLYNGNSSTAQQFAITPLLNDLGNSTHRIRFIAKSGGNEQLVLGTFSDPSNESTFTSLDTLALTTSELEYVYNFTATTTDQYIGFHLLALSSYDKVYIDNVVWEPMPSCLKPTVIETVNTTSTEIELSWNNPSDVNDFTIEYGVEGFVLGTGTQVISTDTFKTITGLNSSTHYDFYIKSVCSSTDSSAWSTPYSEQTTCVSIVTIDEDFENLDNGDLPICWNRIVNSTSSSPYVKSVTSGSPASGNQQISLYNSSAGSNLDLVLISPELTTLNNKRLKFYARGGGQMKIGSMTDPTDLATFTPIDSVNIVTVHQEYDFILNGNYTGQYLAFKSEPTTSYTYTYIDHVRLTDLASCLEPSDLSSEIISQTETELSWVSNGSEISWEIEYGQTGFTPGNGQTLITSMNSTTVSGLTYGDTLDFYVKAICSSTDTSVSSLPLTFIMECAPETGLTIEDFTTFLPNCWSRAKGQLTTNTQLIPDDGTSNWSWKSDGFLNNSTTGAARMNIFGSNAKQWLISNSIKLENNHTKILEFDAGLTDYNNSSAPESGNFGDDDRIVIVISTDNGATWNSVNTLMTFDTTNAPSHTGEHYQVDLSAYSGVVKIGFYGESLVGNEDNDFFIDNFEISEMTSQPMKDISILSIGLDSVYCVNEDVIPIVSVKNTGAVDISDYSLTLNITGPQSSSFNESVSTTLEIDSVNEVMFGNILGLPTGVYLATAEVVTTNDSISTNNVSTFTFTIEDTPIITINTDTTICKGESIVLNASGGTSVQWSGNNANGNTVTPNITTTYTCTVMSAGGCVSTESFTVTVNASPEPTIDVVNQVLYAGEMYTSYSWSFNGQVVAASDSLVPTDNGIYTLEVTDVNGCTGIVTEVISGLSTIEYDMVEAKLYPNPTTGILYINVEDIKVTVANVFGQHVKTLYSKEKQINLSELKSGVYMIYYQIDNRTYYGKVIKQ